MREAPDPQTCGTVRLYFSAGDMFQQITRFIALTVALLPLDPRLSSLKAAEVPLPTEKPKMFGMPTNAAETPLPRSKPEKGSSNSGAEQVERAPGDRQGAIPEALEPQQAIPTFNLEQAKNCEGELRRLRVKFDIGDRIKGDGSCGLERPLKLSAVSGGIAVRGVEALNCTTTLALAKWLNQVVKPSAKLHLGTEVSQVNVSTTYQCRRRNNAPSGKLSEHAFGNGVDVLGFDLLDGRAVAIVPRIGSDKPERAFQAAVRGGACAYFTTVIGPGTNASHASHLHLDMIKRRSGFRLCE